MDLNFKVKYWYEGKGYSWLCFKCAVKLASAGIDVQTSVDDYDSEYYMGQTWCDHPEIPIKSSNEKK